MVKNIFKSLTFTILCIFAMQVSVFAMSLDITVDSNNNSTIKVKDINKHIYSIQIELNDTNKNTGFKFTPNKDFYYKKFIENSGEDKTNLIILIDEVDKKLNESGDLIVGVLTSTNVPKFDSTAKVILVDENLKSYTENVTVTAKYNQSTTGGGSSGGSSSGGGSSGGSSSGGSSSGSSSSSSSSSSTVNNSNKIESPTTEQNNTEQIQEENKVQIEQPEEGVLNINKVNLPIINQDLQINFNDTNNVLWAKSSIDKLAKASIISGDGKGNFNPNLNSKRADVVIMLIKLLGITGTSKDNFEDVHHSKYYANYVGIAKEYGLVNGSNGKFNPESNITRQDTMVIVANILKQIGLKINGSTENLKAFNDSGHISDYAKESVAILINSGIISGNDGNINPKSYITRAEISVVISKLYDLIYQAKYNN